MLKTSYSNRLPHLAPIGATFFVTFRLADSLPQPILKTLVEELENTIAYLQEEKPDNYEQFILNARKQYFRKFDHQLDDKPYGNCYLKQPEIAQIVVDKLREYDGKYYELNGYCIMPNHVHVVLDFSEQIWQNIRDSNQFNSTDAFADYVQLDKVMQLIKGGSALTCNRQLKRTGTFWYKDSYDHFIRNGLEWQRILSYIKDNPVKARLIENWEDWQFTYITGM
jgi:putative transposase